MRTSERDVYLLQQRLNKHETHTQMLNQLKLLYRASLTAHHVKINFTARLIIYKFFIISKSLSIKAARKRIYIVKVLFGFARRERNN